MTHLPPPLPVVVPNRDGLPIRADLHRPAGDGPFPLVLVAHGFKGFKDWGFFPCIAERLAAAGLAALRFDFARNGIGDAPGEFSRLDLFEENSLSHEIADVADLLDALPGEPALDGVRTGTAGILGHSRGGTVAILAAARDARLAAVVALAAVARFERLFPPEMLRAWAATGRAYAVNQRTGQTLPLGRDLLRELTERKEEFDVPAAARALAAPLHVVHGEADETVPVADAHAIHAATDGRAALTILPGAGHTFGAVHPFAGPTPELDRALAAAIETFRQQLHSKLKRPIAGFPHSATLSGKEEPS